MKKDIPTAWVIAVVVVVLVAIAVFYYSRLTGPVIERTPPPPDYFGSAPTAPQKR